ncbi:ABC-three component system middle component 6 [Amphritea japonica]|uniref:ABC-three component system middle component 6 n=1 Tax=Amphritea japonica TaxID=452627 RepID=UPI0035E40C31
MLTPHRFTNFNYCLVYVSSLVIECLIYRGDSNLSELYKYCKASSTEINEQDITLAVSFLYLLSKAKYNIETDIVTLV